MKTLCTPKNLLAAVALIALAGPALAQEAMKMTFVAPDALTWKDNPALPKGAQTAVVIGDPTKAGEMFVARTKFPPNYQVPAHTHPMTESVTVISGSFNLGEGDKLDTQKGTLLKAGSYLLNPAKHAHYGWTGNEEAVVQVQGIGPAGTDYINPADDPRKK
jgi:quercetin dioxygenase-like cupin family protein